MINGGITRLAKFGEPPPTPPPTEFSSFNSAPPDSGFTNASSGFTVGMQFSIDVPFVLTQMGRFYDGADVQDHTVGLWDTGGNLLAFASVSAATASDAFGIKWSTTGMVNVPLPAGTYYLAVFEDVDASKAVWTPDLNPHLICNGSAYAAGSMNYPGANFVPDGQMYSGAAFKFTV